MIRIMSFGYKHGIPEADIVIDCRMLKNPHNDPKLREKDGRVPEVRRMVMDSRAWEEIEQAGMAAAEKHPNGVIAFGCTGGRHRSVVVAAYISARLLCTRDDVKLTHRELK